MHRQRFGVLVAGLFAVTVGAAGAQEPDTTSAGARAATALVRLGLGERVRIVSSGVGFAEGAVLSRSATFVTLRTARSTIEIPAARVDSLWVRQGTYAGRGALIGGVAGAVFFGTVFGGLCQREEGCTNKGVAILVGGLAGAVPGGLLGALIGVAFPKWQLRVP